MKSLQEKIQENMVNERKVWDSLYECLEEHITEALISAWDETGIEFTRDELKENLEKLAKEYDVDKHIDWAKDLIK